MRIVLLLLLVSLTVSACKPASETSASNEFQAMELLRDSDNNPSSDQPFNISVSYDSGLDVAKFECTSTTSQQALAACEQRCLAIQSNAEENHLLCGCQSINNGCSCDCPD